MFNNEYDTELVKAHLTELEIASDMPWIDKLELAEQRNLEVAQKLRRDVLHAKANDSKSE